MDKSGDVLKCTFWMEKVQNMILFEYILHKFGRKPPHTKCSWSSDKCKSRPDVITYSQVARMLADNSCKLMAIYEKMFGIIMLDGSEGTAENISEDILQFSVKFNQNTVLRIKDLFHHLSAIACGISVSWSTEALLVIHAFLIGEHSHTIQEQLVQAGFMTRLEEMVRKAWEADTLAKRRFLKLLLLRIMCIFSEHGFHKYLLLDQLLVEEIQTGNASMMQEHRVNLPAITHLQIHRDTRAALPLLITLMKEHNDLNDQEAWKLLVTLLITFSVYHCEKLFVMETICQTRHVIHNILQNADNRFFQKYGFDLVYHLTKCNPYAIKELSSHLASLPSVGETAISRFMSIAQSHIMYAHKFIRHVYQLCKEEENPNSPRLEYRNEEDPEETNIIFQEHCSLLLEHAMDLRNQATYLHILMQMLMPPMKCSDQTLEDEAAYFMTTMTIFVTAKSKEQLRECMHNLYHRSLSGSFISQSDDLFINFHNVLLKCKSFLGKNRTCAPPGFFTYWESTWYELLDDSTEWSLLNTRKKALCCRDDCPQDY